MARAARPTRAGVRFLSAHRELRRRIGLVALLLYSASIALAAWRHEIRPAALDAPVAWAREMLAVVGIPPGVAVFTAEVAAAQDAKIVSQCLRVRAVDPSGRVRQLHPPPGRSCPRPPPRLWVRGEEIALYRSTTALRSAAAAQRDGALASGRRAFARLLAEALGEHFRGRARGLGFAAERYALRWEETRLSYARGETHERTVALFRWWSDAERGMRVSWRPDPQTLRRDWPEGTSP